MRTFCVTGALAVATLLFAPANTEAVELLRPGDAIIAIDIDPPRSDSSYPEAESPSFAVDGTLAKYLNFAGAGSGFIVTPNIPGSSIAEGIQLTTANDFENRDPTSFELWGTTDPITSANNSTGLAENWSLIAQGDLTLPSDRDTIGSLVYIANTNAYTSYKLVFPTNKGGEYFQIAEVEIFGDVPSLSVFDAPLLFEGDFTEAIHFARDSRFPGAEGPENVLDGDTGTKYLNFGNSNSGFIVTPATGPSVVGSFQITTANDHLERDPTSYEIYGTNDPILSQENSQGDGEQWTLIAAGLVDLPDERMADGPVVHFDNNSSYSSYRVTFPTLVDDSSEFPADSMQISGFQFFTAPVRLPGDFDSSGGVENGDLTLLLNNWAHAATPPPAGWTGIPQPTDPAIDNDELTALLNGWGQTVGGGMGSTVPEPATYVMLVVGLCGVLAGRDYRA